MFRNLTGWLIVALCIGVCLYLAQKGAYDTWNAMFYNRSDDHVLPALGELLAACVSLKLADRVILSNSYGR